MNKFFAPPQTTIAWDANLTQKSVAGLKSQKGPLWPKTMKVAQFLRLEKLLQINWK